MSVRIIAGEFRGRRLQTPRDRTIRPTSERAREALFNILEQGAPPVRDARFLDLFCGTGAIGLEALSRGAAEVLMVDNDRVAVALAEANLAALAAPAPARVRNLDASRLGTAAHPFDLVFLDPPYGADLVTPALAALIAGDWLAPDARIIVELAAKEALALPAGFSLDQERTYGTTSLRFLRLG